MKVFAVFYGNEGYEGYYDGEHSCENFKLIHAFSSEKKANEFIEGDTAKRREKNRLFRNYTQKLNDFRNNGPFHFSDDSINPPEPVRPNTKKPVFNGDKAKFAFEMEKHKEVHQHYSLAMKEYDKQYRNEERLLILNHRQNKQKQQQIEEYRKVLANELTDGKYTADQIEKMNDVGYGYSYKIQETELD